MEFDKQILNSHESAQLCGSFSKSNQHVCRYKGRIVIWIHKDKGNRYGEIRMISQAI